MVRELNPEVKVDHAGEKYPGAQERAGEPGGTIGSGFQFTDEVEMWAGPEKNPRPPESPLNGIAVRVLSEKVPKHEAGFCTRKILVERNFGAVVRVGCKLVGEYRQGGGGDETVLVYKPVFPVDPNADFFLLSPGIEPAELEKSGANLKPQRQSKLEAKRRRSVVRSVVVELVSGPEPDGDVVCGYRFGGGEGEKPALTRRDGGGMGAGTMSGKKKERGTGSDTRLLREGCAS